MRIVFSCAFEISPSRKNQGKTEGFGLNTEQWWRRGESNPRPKGFSQRHLHAYLLI